MSSMKDPLIDENLIEDKRFANSETSTIDPLHAIMRCILHANGNPVEAETIMKVFIDHGSQRRFTPTEMREQLDLGVREGLLDLVPDVGWRCTEAGRSALGPILEMDIKFV